MFVHSANEGLQEMFAKLFSKLLLLGCVASLVLALAGCGGDMTPQGPELGELERYMNEHPELKETSDEEMGEIDGDEFNNAEAS